MQEKTGPTRLIRAKTPESVGVSTKALAKFIEEMEELEIECHSLMVLRDGKVAYEAYADPLGPGIPHVMYSVSKSFTATAIGFAVEEGLLTLETKVLDIFPEYKPEKEDPYLEKLNIFHLLTMTAGKDVPTLSDKARDTWTEDFFAAKWAFEPGTFFRYVSENTYILSAAISRLTGQSLSEYLAPRLYEPLGYARVPFWEKNGEGIDAGGWGIYLKTEELAKFILCYQQGGMFEGKQVIPADWAQKAVKKQVESLQYEEISCIQGYGYGFWLNPVENSYRADGLFSQFGMVFADQNACLIMTASEIFEDKARECVWRHFPGVFTEKSKEETPELPVLKGLPRLEPRPRSESEKKIDGKILKLSQNPLYAKAGMTANMVVPVVTKMNYERHGDIQEIRFKFYDDYCSITWREGLYKNTIECGMDGKYRFGNFKLSQYSFTSAATAAWEDENTFAVWVNALEAVGQRRLKLTFSEDKIIVHMEGVPDGETTMKYLSDFVGYFVKPKLLVEGAKWVLSKGAFTVEPKRRGRLK
ncbi:MAG TPA: serine hydrolase [Clostridiales bacterium]|nr:serine hydrolase [Clostridiales bacterium]